jgi:hypothetical protein
VGGRGGGQVSMGGSKTAAYRQAHCAPGRVLCAPGRFPLSRLRSSCKVHSVRWGRRTAAHLSSVPRIGCVILAGARHRPHPFPVALPASPCSRPAAAPCTQSFKSVGLVFSDPYSCFLYPDFAQKKFVHFTNYQTFRNNSLPPKNLLRGAGYFRHSSIFEILDRVTTSLTNQKRELVKN